jgi:hypothetical protein
VAICRAISRPAETQNHGGPNLTKTAAKTENYRTPNLKRVRPNLEKAYFPKPL